jgi:hypothetical protein
VNLHFSNVVASAEVARVTDTSNRNILLAWILLDSEGPPFSYLADAIDHKVLENKRVMLQSELLESQAVDR